MLKRRLEREKKTVRAMIRIYCRAKHQTGSEICPECEKLYGYAGQRIDNCPFGVHKPVCAKCSIHCYRSEMRGKIIEVMRYSGPRMFLKHPVLTLFHFWDAKYKQKRRSAKGLAITEEKKTLPKKQ
ncbi:MAG: nitrous oxide-stimulated promoter family protein [Desulfitobacteriia bacterium]